MLNYQKLIKLLLSGYVTESHSAIGKYYASVFKPIAKLNDLKRLGEK